jgi:Transcriptional regulator, AbiEi antitoxin
MTAADMLADCLETGMHSTRHNPATESYEDWVDYSRHMLEQFCTGRPGPPASCLVALSGSTARTAVTDGNFSVVTMVTVPVATYLMLPTWTIGYMTETVGSAFLGRLAGLPPTFATAQARAAGISSGALAALRDRGLVDELSRGVFRRSDAAETPYADLLAVTVRAQHQGL